MRIVDIREQAVPLRSEIRNAVIDFSEMTVSAVAVISDQTRNGKPVVGYGFNSNGRYSQSGILRERLIPRLLRAKPESLLTDEGSNVAPERAWQVMMANEKPGGHGDRAVAVGAVDMALWDLAAKIEGKPLYQLLAELFRDGKSDPNVYVYAAGGYYYPGKGLEALQQEMRRYLDLGYRDVKMKIGGANLEEDLERIEAVLELLPDPACLAVDANGRFELDEALRYSEALNSYGLKWYEEPGDPLDYQLHSRVAEVSTIPIATGENLFSFQDSRNLIRHGGLNESRDFLQMDPALGSGLVEYMRTLRMLSDHGWSWRRCIPHGGHQFALHIAAGLGLGGNESYPGVFQPFGGFADNVPVEDGSICLADDPGIGIEKKESLFSVFREITG